MSAEKPPLLDFVPAPPNERIRDGRNEKQDPQRCAERKGKAKEAAGKSVGSSKLESKGKADQAKAKVKKTGEKVKDVFR